MPEVKTLTNKLKLRKLPIDANSGVGALNIVTTSLPAGIEGISYSADINSTGGTAPYIYSLIVGDLPSGLSLTTSGHIGGTTDLAGSYAFTIQVSDGAGATDSQVYTVIVDAAVVPSDLGGTNHSYYNTLTSRPDWAYKNSLRTNAELTPYGGDGIFVSYAPDSDTDDHRQDAARFWIPAFNFITFSNSYVTQQVEPSDTVINLAVVTSTYQQPREIKIDNEIVKVTSRVDGTPGTITVLRAQHGTTAAQHLVGAPVGLSGNSAKSIFIPIATGEETHKYFFVWDTYYPDEWLNTGLTNHKTMNFRLNGIWLEPNTFFTTQDSGFDPAIHVAGWQNRYYGPAMPIGFTNDQPITPRGTFMMPVNKWIRWYYLLEMTKTVDAFTQDSVVTLAADITDPAALTMNVNTSLHASNIPFIVKNTPVKIDNEIVILGVDNGTLSTNLSVPIIRGAMGTTAATHSAGAMLRWPANCYLTVWMADEDHDPVKMHDHVGLTALRPGAKDTDVPNVGTIEIDQFQFEFNTSTSEARNRYDRDLNIYVRDWVVLRDPPASDYTTPGSGLLLKPVSV